MKMSVKDLWAVESVAKSCRRGGRPRRVGKSC
jgi:hypothetical protein